MVLTMERPLARVLTADEWDALPDTSGLELIDGVVHAMPGATYGHEKIKNKLHNRIEALLAPDLVVATELEVWLSDRHRRRPDVLVLWATHVTAATALVHPDRVVIAMEVVSPGSETTDRKHKPIEYADAGIPHFWRVETRPVVSVHTYRLGERGHYRETGAFYEGDRVADPTLQWAAFTVNDPLP